MSKVLTCPNCRNVQDRGRYCSKCGADLSGVAQKPLLETATPARDYGTLRFVSSLMVLFGWLVIIGSIIAAVMNYSQYVTGEGAIVFQGQSNAPLNEPNRLISPGLSALFIAVVGMAIGLTEIAAGQVIMVLLDILDDVRKIYGNRKGEK